MLCDLVRTFTSDGLRLDGALHVPSGSAPDAAGLTTRCDAVVTLHGVGGNFYTSSLFEGLTPSLLAAGVAVLWANTRGHDSLFAASAGLRGRCWLGAAVEKVGDCQWDVPAWLNWLSERGYRRLGVIGHSLGAVKAVFSQAQALDPRVTAVVALSPPRLSYAAFQYDERAAAFQAAVSEARLAVREGQPERLLQVGFPYTQWMAAATYLEKYGPDENYNFLRFVERVRAPLWFAYGARELADGSLAFAGVPDAIRSAVRPDQQWGVEIIPGADHNYAGVVPALAERLVDWLRQPANR